MRHTLYLLSLLILIGCSPEPKPELALNDWLWSQRAFPTGKVNNKLYHAEKDKALAERNLSLRNASEWEFEGPTNVGGRITDIAMSPQDTNLIWVGSASGGAFKSEDGGSTWSAMTENIGAPPIGDLAVRSTNTNDVWIGTGESNGGSGSIAYEGFGVLRSRNGGNTWEHIGLEESGSISRITLHPTDPNTAYVAAMGYLFEENAQRGIFKTVDGGATWENVLYLGERTGGSDLIIDPNDPDILYASMWERIKYPDHKVYWGPNSGLYKSEDGGTSWRELDLGTGVDSLCRIGVAMAPSNNNILYALATGINGVFEGFYVSYDAGESWSRSAQDLSGNYRTAGYWYCNVTVDPTDADHVLLCGLNVLRTRDGGQSFEGICGMHVDQHSIYFHPRYPHFGLIGNDGGLYQSSDQFVRCEHFKNLPITQFYTCTLDPIDESMVYGGTQDNNPLIRRSNQNNWNRMLGGDGFVTLADPRDNQILYTEYQFGNIFKSYNGGEDWGRIRDGLEIPRSNWETPFMFEPDNPDALYIGTHKVHKTISGGDLWYPISPDLSNGPGRNLVYGTITSLDVSPLNTDVIIAGTDDGNVWITRDSGDVWEKISDDLPERWVTSVVCDPHNESRLFVSFSGLKWHEYQPHIFRSDDYGQNWQDIGLDLPEVPVNDIIVDPLDQKRYWIATDVGVYESQDEGESWFPLGTGMPMAIINDIDFRESDRRLLAATYGRSMYSIELPPITTSDEEIVAGTDVDVYSANGRILLKGAKGQYRVELYSLAGQILYGTEVELSGRRSEITYANPQNLTQIIAVVRPIDGTQSQAFKLLL